MSLTDLTVTIEAGPHDRRNCPVRFGLPEPLPQEGSWELRTGTETRGIPVESVGEKDVAAVLPEMAAGTRQTYRMEQSLAVRRHLPNVQVVQETGKGLTINRRNSLLTRYVYEDVPARPYFYPVMAPGQVQVTRAYPMRSDVPGEMKDHPHHRSLWIAFGEVNGADNWSEEAGHGYTLHQSLDRLQSGDVCGGFSTTSLWADSQQRPLLTQSLTVTAWDTEDTLRLLDFAIDLKATHGDVTFGDTKEGGILAARVATSMDVPRGGRIENVYGGIDEAETWGRAAHWCDYSGEVEGRSAGIAILDHPHSFRYPTHWHVRNYGLMTANPFGYAAYTNGLKNGRHVLPDGETLSFRYRVVLHEGNAAAGQVNARYLDYVSPPRVTFGEKIVS